MKKNILYIVLVATIIIGIFIALILNANKSSKNGFIRVFKLPKIELQKLVELESKHFYFTGSNHDHVVLKDNSRPWLFFTLDNALARLKTHSINFPSIPKEKSVNLLLEMQDQNGYLYNRSNGDFTEFIKSKNQFINYPMPNHHFDQFCILSNNSICIRPTTLTKDGKQRELVKIKLSDTIKAIKKRILPKQIDGFFCTDGALTYDLSSKRIFYTYYYRGEFLILDSNLNTVIKGKTIDTVTTANFELKDLKKKLSNGLVTKSTTQVGIPDMINRCYTTDSNFIYIISGLKADNETSDSFKKNEVIDIYSLKNGKYLQSLYISRYMGKRIKHFIVSNGYIYAITGNYLVSSSFNPLTIN